MLGTSRYLENSTELGKEVEAQFTEKAKALSPDERLSAFNAHMYVYFPNHVKAVLGGHLNRLYPRRTIS